ncbi:MAG: hypothetical protein IPJ34_08425 [Myxococcales bacterium]|nr:hypothetical protein [Myxococcales bacterium]
MALPLTSAIVEALPAPDFRQIDQLRARVEDGSLFPGEGFPSEDSELRESLAIVCGELLENAAKYSDWTAGRSVSLTLIVEGADLVVRVENPVRPGDEHVRELLMGLAWLEAQPSAAVAYQHRVMAIAAARPGGPSRLGLLRIAYEAGCSVVAELDPTETLLTMVARLPVR